MSDFFSRHRRAAIVLAIFCSLAGLFGLRLLNQQPEPTLPVREIVIRTLQPGVPADALEEAVGRPLDELLRRSPGITSFRSRTWTGLRLTYVEASAESAAVIHQDVQRLASELAGENPGLIGPNCERQEAAADLVLTLKADTPQQLRQALPNIINRVASLPSVASVEAVGLPARRVAIRYKDADLARSGLSPAKVTALIRAHGPQAPGAYIDDGKTLSPVHADIRLTSVERLRGIIVPDPVDNHPTTLDRLLDIDLEEAPSHSALIANGTTATCLVLRRQTNIPAHNFSTLVMNVLEQECTRHGIGSPFVLLDAGSLAKNDASDFARAAFYGLLAIGVVLMLLLGFRNGLLATCMVPLSLLSTVAVLVLLGQQVDLVTLGAFTIALGIVTDNHLVMTQSIARSLHSGRSREQAVRSAFKLLATPLAAATIANVVGFLPASLADHPMGEFLQQFAMVLAIALGFSYLYAFALTPFFSINTKRHPLAWLEKIFERGLRVLLKRPLLPCLLALPLLAVGPWLLSHMPMSFFPEAPRPLLIGELTLADDSSPSRTKAAAFELGKSVSRLGNWTALCGDNLPAVAGYGHLRSKGPASALFLIPCPTTDAADAALKTAMSFAVPAQATLTWRLQTIGPRASSPERFEVSGPSDALATFAAQFEKAQADFTGLFAERQQQNSWRIVLDKEQASRRHVTPFDLALALAANSHGLPILNIHHHGEAIPVVLTPHRRAETGVDTLEEAFVYPVRGEPCLISDIAALEKILAASFIDRKQGQPMLSLIGDNKDPAITAQHLLALQTLAAGIPGLQVEDVGLSRLGTDATQALYDQLPLAVLIIIIVLLLQTGSLRRLLCSLTVIPLGIGGSVLALYVAGIPLSFMAMLGVTAMAGLALNISIVLTAAIRQEMAMSDVEPNQAIARAAASRLEPILLSTLCAFAGSIPLAYTGDGLWLPLALSLIGGLAVATLGGLLIVPLFIRLLLSQNTVTKEQSS